MHSIEPVDPRIATLPHSGQGASSRQAGAQARSGGETPSTPAQPLADLMSFHPAGQARLPADALAALSRLTQALAQQASPQSAPPAAASLPAADVEGAAQQLQNLLKSEMAQRQPGQWVQQLGQWAASASQAGAGQQAAAMDTMAQVLQGVLRELFQSNLAGAPPAPSAPPAAPPQGGDNAATPQPPAQGSSPSPAPPASQASAPSPAAGATPVPPTAASTPTSAPSATPAPAPPAGAPPQGSNPAPATPPPATQSAAANATQAGHQASPAAIARLQALVDMARVQSSFAQRANAHAAGSPASTRTQADPGVKVNVDPARAAQLLDEAVPSGVAAKAAPSPSQSAPPRTDGAPRPASQATVAKEAPAPREAAQAPPAAAQKGVPARESANAKLEALGFRIPDAQDPAMASGRDGPRATQQSFLWETIVPVELSKATVPARLRMEWQEPRDGEGDGPDPRRRAKPSVLSLAIETEALGRMSFHLAWTANEVAGTVWIERTEVAEVAEGELGLLRRRLKQAGVPDPNLEIRRGHEDELPGDGWDGEGAA